MGYTYHEQGSLNADTPGTLVIRAFSCSCPLMTKMLAKTIFVYHDIKDQCGCQGIMLIEILNSDDDTLFIRLYKKSANTRCVY
jgi:hypothetical protein